MKKNTPFLFIFLNLILCLATKNYLVAQTTTLPIIDQASFEGIEDGIGGFSFSVAVEPWRTPNNDDWSPLGGGSTVTQINTNFDILPDGIKASKLPASGARVLYQEIDVTANTQYALTFYNAFDLESDGEITLSILKPETANYEESLLSTNIIASITEDNSRSIVNVFKKHSLLFDSGENESVIIFATNSGDETRFDAFEIVANPSSIQHSLVTIATGGTINLNPEPIINGTYAYGTEVTVTAAPNEGYQFDGFKDLISYEDNSTTIIIDNDISIEALFSKATCTLTVDAEATNGIIDISPEVVDNVYETGTEVTITAIPSEGYLFDNWSGDFVGTENPLIITINENTTILASFTEEMTASLVDEVYNNTIIISPNPTSNFINISTIDISNIEEVSVVSLIGEEVFKTKQTKIDISHLSNGIYLLKVKGVNNEIAIKKIIKK